MLAQLLVSVSHCSQEDVMKNLVGKLSVAKVISSWLLNRSSISSYSQENLKNGISNKQKQDE